VFSDAVQITRPTTLTRADPSRFRGTSPLAIVTADMAGQLTRESSTDANSPGRIARRRISPSLVRKRLLLYRRAWLTVPLSSNASCSRLASTPSAAA
jgi:hypothetical protein